MRFATVKAHSGSRSVAQRWTEQSNISKHCQLRDKCTPEAVFSSAKTNKRDEIGKRQQQRSKAAARKASNRKLEAESGSSSAANQHIANGEREQRTESGPVEFCGMRRQQLLVADGVQRVRARHLALGCLWELKETS